MMTQLSLSKFEALDGALDRLNRMGEFETCADPRGYVRQSNVLFDACLDAGMSFDEPDHVSWAHERVFATLMAA